MLDFTVKRAPHVGLVAAAQLLPNSEAIGRGGNLLVADADYDAVRGQIRLVAVTTGTFFGQQMTAGNIYAVVGSGKGLYSGDGGPARRGLAPLVLATASSAAMMIRPTRQQRRRFHEALLLRLWHACCGTFLVAVLPV